MGGIISIFLNISVQFISFIIAICSFIFSLLKRTFLIYPFTWIVCTVIISQQKEGYFYVLFSKDYIFYIWLVIGVIITIISFCCMIRGIIRLFAEDFCWGDIPRYFQERKDKKREEEWQAKKQELYKKYPSLEKEELYFKREVCQDEFKVLAFEMDWGKYLIEFMYDADKFIPFDQWYEKNERWKTTNYNSLYFKRYGKERETAQTEQKTIVNENKKSQDTSWFLGISTEEELHKRYKELMKIYHPDNKTGDNSVTVLIQSEYNKLLKNY